MEIRISDTAVDFFKQEMNVPEDKGIRIKGKVYGKTNVHDNFSVAIEVKKPVNPSVLTEQDGLTVFVEKTDEWFISNWDLEIDYDAEHEVPTYFFLPDDGTELDVDATSGASENF